MMKMNPAEVLRIVDGMHREKDIPKDLLFQAIEAAVKTITHSRM